MGLFSKLFEIWNVSDNQRLSKIKIDIKAELKLFANLDHVVSNKSLALSAGKLSTIKRSNQKLIESLLNLLVTDQKEEQLQLRKLLKSAMLINPKNRPSIKKYLQHLYQELEIIERKILELLQLAKDEDTLAGNKSALQQSISKQVGKIDDLQHDLSNIDRELKKNILTEMFGGETKYRCPKCKMKYVEEEKKQVKANPRLHEYTFFCHFCNHTESVTDEKLHRMQKKWS